MNTKKFPFEPDEKEKKFFISGREEDEGEREKLFQWIREIGQVWMKMSENLYAVLMLRASLGRSVFTYSPAYLN